MPRRLKTVSRKKDAETELGKPVISSNQALGWHCLRLAGVNDRLPQFGSLFVALVSCRRLMAPALLVPKLQCA